MPIFPGWESLTYIFATRIPKFRFACYRMILISITILFFAVYSFLIIFYWRTWVKIPSFVAGASAQTRPVSIIVPARNEKKNIARLLTSLQLQNYPTQLTEIIVVDDHSEDDTAEIARKFPGVTVVQLKEDSLNSYKKKAIETGIKKSTGEIIVATDADCVVGPAWLNTLVSFKDQYHSVFLAAPVGFIDDPAGSNKLLYNFQTLDFLVLQGITAVSVFSRSHSMCNGANLAYEKKVFNEVNGFEGIDHIASGDDMLLMHKISKQYPDRVHYIKSRDSIVYTQAAASWKEFFNQRIRWASKANQYDEKRIYWILLLVYLFNLCFLVLLIAGFRNNSYWFWALVLWVAKTIIEFPFVNAVAAFFGKRSLMKYFFFLQPLHIFYTIIAGLFGQFGKYEWKARKVR